MNKKTYQDHIPQANEIPFKSLIFSIAGSIATISSSCYANDLIYSIDDQYSYPNLGMWLLLYGSFLIFSRSFVCGFHYILEILWGCNTALFMAGIGMISGRPLLVGTSTLIVALDQLSWYIDWLGYLATGAFPLGVAKYMLAPTTSRLHFYTGFHHLWFLPTCIWTLTNHGMPQYSYTFSVIFTSMLAIIARMVTPYAVFEGKRLKVLNINMAFAFWHDVEVGFAHWYNHHHPMIYLPYLIIVCNLALNTLPVLFMYYMLNYLKGE